VQIKIGVADVPRDLVIEVDSPDDVIGPLEQGLAAGNALVWLTDKSGARLGLVASYVAYVEVPADKAKPGVGFGR